MQKAGSITQCTGSFFTEDQCVVYPSPTHKRDSERSPLTMASLAGKVNIFFYLGIVLETQIITVGASYICSRSLEAGPEMEGWIPVIIEGGFSKGKKWRTDRA